MCGFWFYLDAFLGTEIAGKKSSTSVAVLPCCINRAILRCEWTGDGSSSSVIEGSRHFLRGGSCGDMGASLVARRGPCPPLALPPSSPFMSPPNTKVFSPVSPRPPVPAGRTIRAMREGVRRPRMGDHAGWCCRGHVQSTDLPGHSPHDVPVRERALGAEGAVAPDFRESAARLVKKIGVQPGKAPEDVFQIFSAESLEEGGQWR